MNLLKISKNILDECIAFYIRPAGYWQQIKEGNREGIFSFKIFFIPALVILILSVMAGDLMFHSQYGFLWKDSLIKGSRKVILLLLILFSSIVITRFIFEAFELKIKMPLIKKIAVFSLSPALITMIFTSLFPFFDLGGIAPWYGLFLVYNGIETFFEIPEKKKFYFYFVLFLSLFVMIMILTYIINKITARFIY